jgi:phospholipase/carboxylesterase
MPLLPSVVVETGPGPVGVIIWLHGLGPDGHDFEPMVPEIRLPASLPLRFVFPHAPVRPVTINGGMRMRAWYDIRSFDAQGRADAAGVHESSGLVDELVRAERARGIDAGKIVLAGFSQGGAIALHWALSAPRELAGVMALSAYLPLELTAGAADGPPPFPVFMAHGTADNMVPFQAGRQSALRVRESGATVEWHEYPMGHSVCPEEIADIRNWLLRVYSGSSPGGVSSPAEC